DGGIWRASLKADGKSGAVHGTECTPANCSLRSSRPRGARTEPFAATGSCRRGCSLCCRGCQRRRSSTLAQHGKQCCQGIRANCALGSPQTDSETPGLARGQSNGAIEWVTG